MTKVAIVKCPNYERENVKEAVERAFELLDVAAVLDLKDKNILLKPNLLMPRAREKRVSTDPEVMRAVFEAVKDAGAGEIKIGDSPGIGSAERVMKGSGYTDILGDLDYKHVEFKEPTKVETLRINKLTLAKEVTETDCLINVAKLKTHGMMGMTLATKNLFGCVVGTHKTGWHFRAGENHALFAEMLVEVAVAAKAKFHILDGIIGMEGNGPTSGTPRELGYIMASTDSIALDRVACHLTGVDITTVPTFAAAKKLGIGVQDMEKIELVGDNPKSIAIDNLIPAHKAGITRIIPLPKFVRRFLRKLFTSKPIFSKKLCKECDACIKMCPADCLARDGKGVPKIDRKKCIRCFCCQEACVHDAITVRSTFISRFFG